MWILRHIPGLEVAELSWFVYSRTSRYGHLYNTNTSLLRTVRLVPEMPKILHSLPPVSYTHLTLPTIYSV